VNRLAHRLELHGGMFHCHSMCGGGRWGPRPASPLGTEILPVYGRARVVSLPHACLAAGLLKPGQTKVNGVVLREMAETKWQGDAGAFLADVAGVGVDTNTIDRAVEACRPAIIGWFEADGGKPAPWIPNFHGVMTDLATVIGLLSRRVGSTFFRDRPPAYDWDTLFGASFEVDEDLGPAPLIAEAPWSAFGWESARERG
jgi:hypothetical protein